MKEGAARGGGAGAQAVAPWEATKRAHPPQTPACAAAKQSQTPGAGGDAGLPGNGPPAGRTAPESPGVRGDRGPGSAAGMTLFGGAPATPPQPPPWNGPRRSLLAGCASSHGHCLEVTRTTANSADPFPGHRNLLSLLTNPPLPSRRPGRPSGSLVGPCSLSLLAMGCSEPPTPITSPAKQQMFCFSLCD